MFVAKGLLQLTVQFSDFSAHLPINVVLIPCCLPSSLSLPVPVPVTVTVAVEAVAVESVLSPEQTRAK